MRERPKLELPRYAHGDIRRLADAFLAKHHPSLTIPVPIEMIVEHAGIDIVPMRGLMSQRGINGFMSSDRGSIFVDEDLPESRYHFTLAHEFGHLTLHPDFFEPHESDVAAIRFHRELRDHKLSDAEFHADEFAGLVLVPPAQILECAPIAHATLAKQVGSAFVDLKGEAFWSYVAGALAEDFGVAQVTMRIRLQRERFWCRAAENFPAAIAEKVRARINRK